MTTRPNGNWCLVFFLLSACAGSRVRQNPPSVPAPSMPNPSMVPTNVWTFSYAPGTLTYQVKRSAAIESQSDSGSRREVSTNTTHEVVLLEAVMDTVYFTAVVDTFSTATQGVIGPVQPVQLPIRVSGSLISDSLVFASDTLSNSCIPVRSALVADLHNLLPNLPKTLSTGLSWRDSTELKGCQGMIPTTAQIIRSYVVSGAVEYPGFSALLVQRVDTIRARGDGAQQQHRISLEATGTGNATYYLDAVHGRVVHLVANADLNFSITASGHTSHFRQNLKQDFSFVR